MENLDLFFVTIVTDYQSSLFLCRLPIVDPDKLCPHLFLRASLHTLATDYTVTVTLIVAVVHKMSGESTPPLTMCQYLN